MYLNKFAILGKSDEFYILVLYLLILEFCTSVFCVLEAQWLTFETWWRPLSIQANS